MTPGARHQKCIDILSSFWSSSLPLDRHIKKECEKARYMGASDRRFIKAFIYDFMRHRQLFLQKACSPREEVLLYLIRLLDLDDICHLWSGENFCPLPLSDEEKNLCHAFLKHEPAPHERANIPLWIYTSLSLTHDQWQTLNIPAPVDIWVNPLKTTPEKLAHRLLKEGYCLHPQGPWSLRGEGLQGLNQISLYKQGYFEFQDQGAQDLCDALPLPEKGSILDLCAGAGGKTLVLRAKASKKVDILATDIAPSRLARAQFRMERAGQKVDFVPYDTWQNKLYDGILIDAPCSGSGTWRRDPAGKWRITPEELKRLNDIQLDLLHKACLNLKPGGWVAYATCSILPQENEQVIEEFLSHDSGHHVNFQKTWNPWTTYTDGFFLSLIYKENHIS